MNSLWRRFLTTWEKKLARSLSSKLKNVLRIIWKLLDWKSIVKWRISAIRTIIISTITWKIKSFQPLLDQQKLELQCNILILIHITILVCMEDTQAIIHLVTVVLMVAMVIHIHTCLMIEDKRLNSKEKMQKVFKSKNLTNQMQVPDPERAFLQLNQLKAWNKEKLSDQQPQLLNPLASTLIITKRLTKLQLKRD